MPCTVSRRGKYSPEDVDFVPFEPGSTKQAAQFRHQAPWLGRVKKARLGHDRLKMGVKPFYFIVRSQW